MGDRVIWYSVIAGMVLCAGVVGWMFFRALNRMHPRIR